MCIDIHISIYIHICIHIHIYIYVLYEYKHEYLYSTMYMAGFKNRKSVLTLALLEDSGWYQVDYGMADLLRYESWCMSHDSWVMGHESLTHNFFVNVVWLFWFSINHNSWVMSHESWVMRHCSFVCACCHTPHATVCVTRVTWCQSVTHLRVYCETCSHKSGVLHHESCLSYGPWVIDA